MFHLDVLKVDGAGGWRRAACRWASAATSLLSRAACLALSSPLPPLPSLPSILLWELDLSRMGAGRCVRQVQARELYPDGRHLRSRMVAGQRELRASR
jgi:hypothetical protein